MGQSKEPIKLRKRKTPSGMESLYLDIYLNGQRSYEYLKLVPCPRNQQAGQTEESGNAETCRGYPCETACGASKQRIWFQVPVQGGQ